MKAGDLNDRVVIERSTSASDGMGGQTVTWSTLYNLWANVKAVRGREAESLGRQVTVETYLITVRYGLTITTHDRAIWSGKTMNIRSAQDREGTRRWLSIEAETGLGS
jgi:SPP1 family predicted phage head-tail adaptor